MESYSMDFILQIFKKSIYPGTPFFESLAKKPLRTMVDLFKRANKYSMLEDDICVVIQQVLVTSRPARNDSAGGFKLGNQLRQVGKGRGGEGRNKQQQPS